MRERIALVTGAAGFLGTFLTGDLLNAGWKVYTLVRHDAKRVSGQLTRYGFLTDLDQASQLIQCEGDVTKPNLGVDASMLADIRENVTDIWHCATAFESSASRRTDISTTNIEGTKNLIELATTLKRRPVNFHFVSTAYATHAEDGCCYEQPNERTDEREFRNLYEWSKAAGERLALQAHHNESLRIRIYRPSIIVGHSGTGRTIGYNGYQGVFRSLYTLRRTVERMVPDFNNDLRLRITAYPDLMLNLVSVDYVTNLLLRLADAEIATPKIFHVTHPTGTPLGKLFNQGCATLNVNGIRLSQKHDYKHSPRTTFERIFERRIKFQAPYILDQLVFDQSNVLSVLKGKLPLIPDLSEAYFDKMNHSIFSDLEREFGNSAGIKDT